jgi:hypothetical protein
MVRRLRQDSPVVRERNEWTAALPGEDVVDVDRSVVATSPGFVSGTTRP